LRFGRNIESLLKEVDREVAVGDMSSTWDRMKTPDGLVQSPQIGRLRRLEQRRFYASRANFFFHAGNPVLADADLERADALRPRGYRRRSVAEDDARLTRVCALVRLRREEARGPASDTATKYRALEDLRGGGPSNVHVQTRALACLVKRGEDAEARAQLVRARNAATGGLETVEIDLARLHRWHALLAIATGDTDEADDALELAAFHDSGQPRILVQNGFALAHYYFAQQAPDIAVECAIDAMALARHNGLYHARWTGYASLAKWLD
jgi:tetratricopeptide (TPR) repeat protein